MIVKKLVQLIIFNVTKKKNNILGTSCKARLVNLKEYVEALPKKEPIVFVIGAVASGNAGKKKFSIEF